MDKRGRKGREWNSTIGKMTPLYASAAWWVLAESKTIKT